MLKNPRNMENASIKTRRVSVDTIKSGLELMCNSCGLSFPTKSSLKVHSQFCLKKSRSKLPKEEKDDPTKPFHCTLESCKAKFRYQGTLENHLEKFHGVTIIRHLQCGKYTMKFLV